MKRMKIWLFLGCCMIVTCSINCEDSGALNTIALSEDEIQWLEQAGLKLNEGDTPPNIEGSYSLNSLKIVYDDLDLDYPVDDYTYSFGEQNGQDVMMSYSGPNADDSAQNIPGSVFGSGDCFSVLVNVDGTSNGCKYDMPQIVSGCLTEKGIVDFQLGIVMGAKSGTNCDDMLEEKHRRIIEEEDNLAERDMDNTEE